MSKCYFCGSINCQIDKITFKGKNFNKRVSKTVNTCLCCQSMMDDRNLRKIFDWDELISIDNIKGAKKGEQTWQMNY